MQHEERHAEHEQNDHKHKGFGICPVMVILILAKLYHLYNLYWIKDAFTQIRFFKKAKEALAVQNAADEEVKEVESVSPTEATLLDTSDEIEALAPESDKAGADDKPTFSYQFSEPATLPKYGEHLIRKNPPSGSINTSVQME